MVNVQVGKFFILSASVIAIVSCILTENLPEDSCVCTTEDAGVSRKAGYEHSIVRYLLSATCVQTAGSVLNKYGTSWYSLKVDSQVFWCSGDYLSNGTFSNDVCGGP